MQPSTQLGAGCGAAMVAHCTSTTMWLWRATAPQRGPGCAGPADSHGCTASTTERHRFKMSAGMFVSAQMSGAGGVSDALRLFPASSRRGYVLQVANTNCWRGVARRCQLARAQWAGYERGQGPAVTRNAGSLYRFLGAVYGHRADRCGSRAL
ncbi:hypothetical protein DAEQUDRAFT_273330 [Daedalea quercina L-15889]|uniref:Uncharacterized protein n=1 Tax=Daedalea quercina L-15889 TaxID=1314783 RepID=A0A165QDI6_9APHY|nr:hypothetical protein DAEQUDRAFT_273330 [Daedalea quercina L-15889]